MNILQKRHAESNVKAARRQAERVIAMHWVTPVMIDGFIGLLATMLTEYAALEHPTAQATADADNVRLALEGSRRDRGAAEKLFAFTTSFAARLGFKNMTPEVVVVALPLAFLWMFEDVIANERRTGTGTHPPNDEPSHLALARHPAAAGESRCQWTDAGGSHCILALGGHPSDDHAVLSWAGIPSRQIGIIYTRDTDDPAGQRFLETARYDADGAVQG